MIQSHAQAVERDLGRCVGIGYNILLLLSHSGGEQELEAAIGLTRKGGGHIAFSQKRIEIENSSKEVHHVRRYSSLSL